MTNAIMTPMRRYMCCSVRVSCTRTLEEVLAPVARTRYITDAVAKSMPRGEGGDIEVVFFFMDEWVGDDALERAYERQRLKPLDPYTLAEINGIDQTLADAYRNATHWKDKKGRWCYAAFDNVPSEGREVEIDFCLKPDVACSPNSDLDDVSDPNPDTGLWFDGWWFAGVYK